MGVQVTSKCQKWKNAEHSIDTILGGKVQGFYAHFTSQTQFSFKFPRKWENWEYFANFDFRILKLDIQISGKILRWMSFIY